MIHRPAEPDHVRDLVEQLRRAHDELPPVTPSMAIDILDRWGKRLSQSPLLAAPGMVFLTLWLRRGTLQPLLRREMGEAAVEGDWQIHDATCSMRKPLGIVGHFPAANVTIQPLLSLTCGTLAGNAGLVRVPNGLESMTSEALDLLREIDTDGLVFGRICCMTIPSERRELLVEMARGCDGAMIWGGEEAVLAVRSLPFPHWTRLASFGPRTSVAVLDRLAWTDPEARSAWCTRLARDVWQFEQRACSSPQILYVLRDRRADPNDLFESIEQAFKAENQAHPREELDAHAAAAIVSARAQWLIDDAGRQARYPFNPDWTILVGEGIVRNEPVHNRCLFVSVVEDLCVPIRRFDGNVQTLGLGCGDPDIERAVVAEACRRGVDRITQLGRMHVFDSPWDGLELVAPMTRLVRYSPTRRATKENLG